MGGSGSSYKTHWNHWIRELDSHACCGLSVFYLSALTLKTDADLTL